MEQVMEQVDDCIVLLTVKFYDSKPWVAIFLCLGTISKYLLNTCYVISTVGVIGKK